MSQTPDLQRHPHLIRTGNLGQPLFEIVLYQPEIPPNVGNIIRLCANSGCRLHLVRPLGFSLRDRQLHRAGLDYHALAELAVHENWPACRAQLTGRRSYALTTGGSRSYSEPVYQPTNVLVFGSETGGLPGGILGEFEPGARLRVPMVAGSRSLNLSNTVAVVVYEAWRQLGFRGSA